MVAGCGAKALRPPINVMRVAVMTLTRDRLGYTQHCFETLRENAGCEYDHYVLDQGSEDGTANWLRDNAGRFAWVILSDENMGISRGMNVLLDEAYAFAYDVVVTFDNDCEVTMPGTLTACVQAVANGDWVVSPTVNGLNHPLSPAPPQDANGVRVGQTPIVGGIFRTMPGAFARTFRFNENNPPWGNDENDVSRAFPGRVGWLLDWSVNHYETTVGQQQRYPEYWERKVAEIAA